MVSITFGAVAGSVEQIGELAPGWHNPNRYGCAVGANPRAWSAENPSWPCSTTVNTQPLPGRPEPGWLSAAAGTAMVIALDAWLAATTAVPAGFPAASTNTGSAKPCTSIRRDQAESAATVKFRDGNGAAVENDPAAGSRTNTSSSWAPSGEPNVGVRSRSVARK